MKKSFYLFIVLQVFALFDLNAKTIRGTFVAKNEIVAYEFRKSDPNIERYELSFMKFDVNSSENRVIIEGLSNLHFDSYKIAINKLLNEVFGEDIPDRDKIATNLFYELKSRMEFQDDQPMTGIFYLLTDKIFLINDTSLKDVKSNNSKSLILEKENKVKIELFINKVEIEIASGSIKNILIEARKEKDKNSIKVYKFRNNIPIGISGKFDPEKFMDHSIFLDPSTNYDAIGEEYAHVNLSNVLRFDISLENNKEDYSPADTTWDSSLNCVWGLIFVTTHYLSWPRPTKIMGC